MVSILHDFMVKRDKMEIFKTDYLKKEFKKFQKEDLVAVLSCRYCQKTCCKWKYNKFLAGCKYCREFL